MATVESSARPTRTLPVHSTVHPIGSEGSSLVGRLGPWQLVSLIGQGNLTRVYAARSGSATRDRLAAYVVKVLRKEWWRDPHAIAIQRREAAVGSQVSHPSLLPVLSASVTEPPFYIVTPRLAGATLAARLAADRRPTLPTILWIARQVAQGLAALAARTSMIHGDVKPANIFVSPTGHATLMDFGFAQAPGEAAAWAGQPVMGTLAYLAPERFTSALSADSGSDIYSLGVTLYESISGQLPLDSDDPGRLATLQREAKPPCLRELCPTLPKGVASLVHRMLSKDPLRRPSSLGEVIDSLTRLEIECFTLR